MHNFAKIAVTATLMMLPGARAPAAYAPPPTYAPAHPFDGSLSVLTYNVKGLPWPVALGRTASLESIGHKLRSLRDSGEAPSVAVLQEAFVEEARSIGRLGGYRYIADGPAPSDIRSTPMSSDDAAYASRAHWWKGETEGKFVGSGLQVLSDYPIVAVHRMAFPAFACAGFDCLANKGALLVTLDIPGAPTPVDVLTTHLNSRHASGVSDARSTYAYRRQVAELSAFVRRVHDPRFPLIASGDYNVGPVEARQAALFDAVRDGWVGDRPMRDALEEFKRQGGVLDADAAYELRRGRDWQFYFDGSRGKLALTGIEVPFGRDEAGNMLSDHVGYVARFRLSAARTAKATSFGKSTG